MKGEWNPNPETLKILDHIRSLLEEERRSVRDLYYAMKATGWNIEYQKVKYICNKARDSGLLSPHLIRSEEMWIKHYPDREEDSPREWLERKLNSWEQYYRDVWSDQPYYVEVWLEKMSLASVFYPICSKYNVFLVTGKGDASIEMKYQVTGRFIEASKKGKIPVMLYFGDYNPSGCHAPVAIAESIANFSRIYYDYALLPPPSHFDAFHLDWYFGLEEDVQNTQAEWAYWKPLIIDRIALNLDQIEEEFPPNPTPSSSDKDRTIRERFLEWNGGLDLNIELNALKEYRREKLESLIKGAIEKYIDADLWNSHMDRIKEDRKKLQEIMETYEIPEWLT